MALYVSIALCFVKFYGSICKPFKAVYVLFFLQFVEREWSFWKSETEVWDFRVVVVDMRSFFGW